MGPRFNLEDLDDADLKEGPEELTLRKGERLKALLHTSRTDRKNWSEPCQTLYDGVEQWDLESMYNTLREAAKKLGIKMTGERTKLEAD